MLMLSSRLSPSTSHPHKLIGVSSGSCVTSTAGPNGAAQLWSIEAPTERTPDVTTHCRDLPNSTRKWSGRDRLLFSDACEMEITNQVSFQFAELAPRVRRTETTSSLSFAGQRRCLRS